MIVRMSRLLTVAVFAEFMCPESFSADVIEHTSRRITRALFTETTHPETVDGKNRAPLYMLHVQALSLC